MMKSIKECSQLTGMPVHYIRKLVLEDRVKYVRSGIKYFINYETLLEFLNNGK